MNPFLELVSTYARLLRDGKSIPMGTASRASVAEGNALSEEQRTELLQFLATHKPGAVRKALIFSPHPDDECIIGALPLRLLREANYQIANVAVTQGSKKSRQAERLQELRAACDFIGFSLIQTGPSGLENVNAKTRQSDPAQWREKVQVIAGILAGNTPNIIFFPHEQDWNSSHIGTHHLVMDALRSLGDTFECWVVETEFWGAMAAPNLMVESRPEDVADMVAGVSFHVGEVTRNPFHLFLPAWMQDNVRRGSELVGGQGESAPDFTFATLYRLRRWSRGQIISAFEGGKQVSGKENPASLFPSA